MDRDGFKCSQCGVDRDEYLGQWGFDLDIHHIDGKGRSAKEKNNDIDNLIVLCRSCHKKVEPSGFMATKMG